VTELIDGETLVEVVENNGPLVPSQLAWLAQHLAKAVHVIHEAGVIHRDIKPTNVMLRNDGSGPVLIDFGIAQGVGWTRMTGDGLVMGTPGYIAPELICGDEPSVSSDDWGVAALLVFAATGRPPFGIGSPDVMTTRTLSGQVDLTGVAVEAAQALTTALAPNPLNRSSPEQLAQALKAAAAGLSGRLAGPSTPWAADAVATERASVYPASPRVYPPAGRPERPGGLPPGSAGWGENLPPTSVMSTERRDFTEEPGTGGPARHWGPLMAAVWLAFFASALHLAMMTMWASVACLVLGRAAGVGSQAAAERRRVRGSGPWDGVRMVFASPYYLVRAAVGILPSLIPAAAVVAGGYWLTTHVGGAENLFGMRAGDGAALAAALWLTVGWEIAWWGPESDLTRDGVHVALAEILPRGVWPTLVAAVVLIGWAFVGLFYWF
jgi:hypothetical protein